MPKESTHRSVQAASVRRATVACLAGLFALVAQVSAQQALQFPPIDVDPIVNEQDGQATFAGEWDSADWVPDLLPALGTMYGEARAGWTATASNPANQTTYGQITAFILHDLTDMLTQDDWDYNSFQMTMSGRTVTGWVFGNGNFPDSLDFWWIGGSGLGLPFVDDRGFLVRVNNDPTTDVQWFPGDLEPGDPLFDWADYHDFFGTYGFNNSVWDMGLPNSVDGADEVYEVAFRRPGGGFDTCSTLEFEICDPSGRDPKRNYKRVIDLTGKIGPWEPGTDSVTVIPRLGWKAVSIGNEGVFSFAVANFGTQACTVHVNAYDVPLDLGVTPGYIPLALGPGEATVVDFRLNVPMDSVLIGVQDTVLVSLELASAYAILEVAGPLSRLSLGSDSLAMPTDTATYLGAFGYDSDGRPLEIQPSWSASGGIGSVTPDTLPHIPDIMSMARFESQNTGLGYVKASDGSISDSVMVRVSPPAIGAFPGNAVPRTFSITPNPSPGSFRVDYAMPGASLATLRVYSALGEAVLQKTGRAGHFLVKGLQNGAYFVQLERRGMSTTRKLVVLR